MARITEWLEVNCEVPYSDLAALDHALSDLQRLECAQVKEADAAATQALGMWQKIKKEQVERLQSEVQALSQRLRVERAQEAEQARVEVEEHARRKPGFYASRMRQRRF